jgi:selenocysteine lyase/cysteine desulfurase
MPDRYPDHLEAGTPNAAGIAGLLAGCEFLLEEGVEAIHAREAALKSRLWDGLDGISGIRVLSPRAPEGAALVTAAVDGLAPSEVALQLERDWQVLCRAGLHCAPEAHRILGSMETGAVRLSLGWASTTEDVDRALEGLASIAHGVRTTISVSDSVGSV